MISFTGPYRLDHMLHQSGLKGKGKKASVCLLTLEGVCQTETENTTNKLSFF